MIIRPLRKPGLARVFEGGAIASLLLGWSGVCPLWAQTSSAVEIVSETAPTQESPGLQRVYMNKSFIRLPIQVNEQFRSSIREVQLYFKEQTTAPWKLSQTVKLDQKVFKFEAPHDGEFAFAMVTIDHQGKSIPKDVQSEPPALIVVFDTHAPQTELTNLGASAEGQLIGCSVRDDNLDLARVRILFQGGDKQFRPMEAVPGRRNVYCVPTQAVFSGMVRVTAEDLAGNQTTREVHLSQLPTVGTMIPLPTNPTTETISQVESAQKPPVAGTPMAPPELFPAAVKGNLSIVEPEHPHSRMPSITQEIPAKKERGFSDRPNDLEAPRPSERIVFNNGPLRNVEAKNVPLEPVPQILPPGPKVLPKRQLVNQAKVYLDFAIENAGQGVVGNIEVWITRDQGKQWTKLCEAPHGKSPVEVHFPDDGIYGVTLLTAAERAKSNSASLNGTTPEWLIEVDTTKPNAQIVEIQTLQEKDATVVQISWSAQDNNLGNAPVDLFYAATAQGPWLSIVKGLSGEGHYRWTPPESIGVQAYLRVEAHDLAGNKSIANTLEPIRLRGEATIPHAVIRNIRTEGPNILSTTDKRE